MASKTFTVRIEEDLLSAVDKKLGKTVKGKGEVNRNAYILQLIRDDLERKPEAQEMNAKDRAQIFDQETKISKLVNDGLLKELKSRDGQVFSGLSDAELAKMVIQQLPKPKDVDEDLKTDILSLTSALARLPAVEDITAELSKVKQQLAKALGEIEVNGIMMQSLRSQIKGNSPEAWEKFKQAAERLMVLAAKNATEGAARGLEIEFLRPLIVQ